MSTVEKVLVDIEKWKKKNDDKIDDVVRNVVDAVWDTVTTTTPVDTGFANSNWKVSNIPNLATAGLGKKKPSREPASQGNPTKDNFSPRKPVYIFNATEYISILENSYTGTQPGKGGMVASAVAMVRNGLSK